MSTEGDSNVGSDNGSADASEAAASAAVASANTNDSAGGNGGAGDGGDKSAVGFAIPEAYKDKPWAKDFKSVDDVFKSYESAQALIGKPKIGVPNEQATAEEKAAFYKDLGVPDDGKGYEFKRPDGLDDSQWDDKNDSKWADIMRQNNVPKGVANALRDEMLRETLEIHANSTAELNKAMDAAFGDKKLQVTKEVSDLMVKAIPDLALRQKVQDNIGNKNLPAFALALGQAMQHMKKTYGMSDTNTGDDSQNSGASIKELRAEATKMMASEAYTNVMHKDHAAVRKSVDAAYVDIGRLTDSAQKK